MIVIAYLGSQCTTFHTALRWTLQRNSIQFYLNLEKLRRRPWQWLDKRSGKKAWAVHGCLNGMPGSMQTEESREVKNKVEGMLIIFFDIKNLSWQSKQSIPYCDVLRQLREHVRRLRLERWWQNGCLFRHNSPSHSSFSTSELLTKTKMDVVPHQPCWKAAILT
jgi:hypothetical protein